MLKSAHLQFQGNGVASIHITGSNNFTCEGTIGDEYPLGQGNVGDFTGPQPIDMIIDASSLVTFQDIRVSSTNGELRAVFELAVCALQ